MKRDKMTYIQYGERILEILTSLEGLEDKTPLIEKTNLLLRVHKNKASEVRKKESKVSPETLQKAELLHKMLTTELQTCQDINERLGEEMFSPLTLSNLLKYIPVEVVKDQVVRETINKKGLKQQRYYAAYALALAGETEEVKKTEETVE